MTKTPLEPGQTLRHCPFCEGPPQMYVHELDGVPELEPLYQVECSDCGATGPARDNPFDAERWWNRDMVGRAILDRHFDNLANAAQVAPDIE